VVRHRRHRRGRLNDDVLAAGAHRVVVVRAITEAADPHAAARLAERLGPP
jgi:thiamine monophosphate synthase